ncbi:RICIN domain-containing protein [Streptosporangium sp. NBC_01755]|uniref:RICIN domain-containing protein n=1 Tax=unclassified Streptosporangium TaxID=2632669 RepID=UPI002DD7A32F|nr:MULTISPECIES: RICIN domain-containing protein [unclassified Streptosporangium]WSA29475.1 RICIN domain-containing protein [Streptosporangium sp. NBC_01810]WSC99105.1 RICIN domain-containing protein [Streptosporangium sp. NBC_01755]
MRLVSVGQVLALAATLLVVPFAGAPAADVVAAGAPGRVEGRFRANLVARHSGKCLDVVAGGMEDGANVQQRTCDGKESQDWSLTATGGGYYTFKAMHSGKCLDVVGDSRSIGAGIQQWTCMIGARNQEWGLSQRDDGYFVLVARHSGKCLQVMDGDVRDGARLRQWTCVRGWKNQEWRLA